MSWIDDHIESGRCPVCEEPGDWCDLVETETGERICHECFDNRDVKEVDNGE